MSIIHNIVFLNAWKNRIVSEREKTNTQLKDGESPHYTKNVSQTAIKAIVNAYLDKNLRKEINIPNSFEFLIEALFDKNEDTRAIAAYGIYQMSNDTQVQPLIQKAFDPLILTLKDKSAATRNCAILALGVFGSSRDQIGQEKAIEPLIQVLTEKDPQNRGAAAASLGLMRTEKAVMAIEPLSKLLNDDNPNARAFAEMSIKFIKSRNTDR
jgi:HEAT repeat protein